MEHLRREAERNEDRRCAALCNLPEYKETITGLAQGRIENLIKGVDPPDYESKRLDDFFLLSLELSDTLENSFSNFIQPNYLTKQNQYFAQELGRKIDAQRFSKLKHCPPILFITLNRFKYNIQKKKREKISTECTVPLSLDLSQYMTCEDAGDTPKIYHLKAATVHKGTATGGHYICYVKNEDHWLKCDESEVTFESEDSVLIAASGRTQDATGYVFAYEIEGADNEEEEDISTFYQPDDEIMQSINEENELNRKCSLLFSKGYRILISNLASCTHPLFHEICLRYACDTAPYLARPFQEICFYQVLGNSLKNSPPLSVMFFQYSQPFVSDMIVYSNSSTVRKFAGELYKNVCLSGAISVDECLTLIFELIPSLFSRYDSCEYVFRAVRKIVTYLPEAASEFLEEEANKNTLLSFITYQFDAYLDEHPLTKRSYILDGLDLSSFLKLITFTTYPSEQYGILYTQKFLLEVLSTKSKPKSVAQYITKFFDISSFVEYFKQSSSSMKCKTAAGILYYMVPHEATELLVSSTYPKEDVASEIIHHIHQRNKHNVNNHIIDASEDWIKDFLLSHESQLRCKAIRIVACLVPTRELVQLADEEDSDEEEEEEDYIDDVDEDLTEAKQREILANSERLLIHHINCVSYGQEALEAEFNFTKQRSNSNRLYEFLVVIQKLLCACPQIPQTQQDASKQEGEKEEADGDTKIETFYGIEKLAVLCKTIGQTSVPFSAQGCVLLAIFAQFNIPLSQDAILSLLNCNIQCEADARSFCKYTPSLAHFLLQNPKENSLLIQYFIQNCLFNTQYWFKECRDFIKQVANQLLDSCLDLFVVYVDTSFSTCIINNYSLTLEVCYRSGMKKPLISSLLNALVYGQFVLTPETADKIIKVNNETTISNSDLTMLKSSHSSSIVAEGLEKFLEYCEKELKTNPSEQSTDQLIVPVKVRAKYENEMNKANEENANEAGKEEEQENREKYKEKEEEEDNENLMRTDEVEEEEPELMDGSGQQADDEE